MKKKKSQNSFDQHFLNVLMDSIPDSIFFKDLDSRFIKVNQATLKKCGLLSEDEIIGKTDFDIFKKKHAKIAFKDEQKIIKTGKPIINKEVDELWLDGSVTWASVTKIPLKDKKDRIIGTFGLTRDITDLKLKEEKIKNYTKELEEQKSLIEKNAEELRILNADISKSEAQLKKVVSTKDKFFSIISHDLRSPFTSMLGVLQMLTGDFDTLEKQEMRELIESLQNSVQNVYKLLSNLLEWASIQTGRIKKNPEAINLHELVGNIVSLYEGSKGIMFLNQVNENVFAFADKYMIDTVIRNLISNALKFSYETGKIIIKTKPADDMVIVSIRDEGIGISGKDVDDIFKIDKPVTRPGTSQESGTGLGLVLCKEFIENNKGKIWFESAEGKGSTFYFSVPVYKQD